MAEIPKGPRCFIHEEDYVMSKEYHSQLNRSTIWFQNRSSRYASTDYNDTRSDHQHRQPHFLDSCFLCRKSLAGDKDIFMYRGDAPFCSEECRQEQIEMDEAKEQHRNVSSAMRAGAEKSLNSNKAESYSLRTGPGTIAAA